MRSIDIAFQKEKAEYSPREKERKRIHIDAFDPATWQAKLTILFRKEWSEQKEDELLKH